MSSLGPASELCAVETPDGSQGKETNVSPLTVESEESPRVKLGCCDNSNGVGTRHKGSSLQNSVKRGLSPQPRRLALVGTPGDGNGVGKDKEMVTGPASTAASPLADSKLGPKPSSLPY